MHHQDSTKSKAAFNKCEKPSAWMKNTLFDIQSTAFAQRIEEVTAASITLFSDCI